MEIKVSHRNELFYQRKRALQRNADLLRKKFSCQVFYTIYNEKTDKIFCYTTSDDFDLLRVTKLIYKDVMESGFLKKNNKFEHTDFD